jgi:hypothetical protein
MRDSGTQPRACLRKLAVAGLGLAREDCSHVWDPV